MRTNKDNEILSTITDNDGKIIKQRVSVDFFKKRGYYDYLLNRYNNNTTDSFKEIIFRFINDMEEPPKCPFCGNVIKFTEHDKKYPKYCSRSCRSNNPETKAVNAKKVSEQRKKEYADSERAAEIWEKRRQTLKEHTGEDNNGSPLSIKRYRDKAKETIMERYGVDNVLKLKKNHENR